MDEPAPPSSPLPSAAELGISEEEYERILRDVRRRQGVVEPPVEPMPGRRRRGWARWAVLALIAVLAIPLVPGRDPGPEHAFLQTDGGEPVAYTSCRQIRVAVYPAGGPADAEQLVRDAVAQVRRATGLDVVVTGSFGGNAPNWNFEAAPVHPDDPISVSWQDGDAIAELTDHTAGLGGSRVIETPRGTRRLVAGTIALSRDYYDSLEDRGEGLAVLLHEFGHVLGLDHVSSRRELMHPVVNGDLTSYGPGDLEGLRALGRGPC